MRHPIDVAVDPQFIERSATGEAEWGGGERALACLPEPFLTEDRLLLLITIIIKSNKLSKLRAYRA